MTSNDSTVSIVIIPEYVIGGIVSECKVIIQ